MQLDIEAIKQEIIQQLHPLDPERVILFGSYAHGQPTDDSDIDLYVVTKDDFMPQNYAAKRALVRNVSRLIYDLRQQISIDLLVHTRTMHAQFNRMDSSFAREIKQHGVRLL